jgi:ribosomal protein S27AE
MVKGKEQKLHDMTTKYNRQLCQYCGHSMIFTPHAEYLICHYCGRKNYNKTKGYFMRRIYNELQNRER